MKKEFGVNLLAVVPLRQEPSHQSAMLSQLLFGEVFEIIEKTKNWAKILTNYDHLQAWLDLTQLTQISEDDYRNLANEELKFSSEMISYITNSKNLMTLLPFGSTINVLDYQAINDDQLVYEGEHKHVISHKKEIVNTALQFINAPYLEGGKTPFGIDASAFVQMVYKMHGCFLPRQVAEQANLGESLSFIEESEPGDLAYFDDEKGNIFHVGIMLTDNYIIHAFGHVRIDRLDHVGIFNQSLNKHTHQLRIIKQVILGK